MEDLNSILSEEETQALKRNFLSNNKNEKDFEKLLDQCCHAIINAELFDMAIRGEINIFFDGEDVTFSNTSKNEEESPDEIFEKHILDGD